MRVVRLAQLQIYHWSQTKCTKLLCITVQSPSSRPPLPDKYNTKPTQGAQVQQQYIFYGQNVERPSLPTPATKQYAPKNNQYQQRQGQLIPQQRAYLHHKHMPPPPPPFSSSPPIPHKSTGQPVLQRSPPHRSVTPQLYWHPTPSLDYSPPVPQYNTWQACSQGPPHQPSTTPLNYWQPLAANWATPVTCTSTSIPCI